MPVYESLVKGQIILAHAPGAEAFFETAPAASSLNRSNSFHGFRGFFSIMDQEPCDAVINDLRNRTTGVSDNRGAACHCLDHDQAKRLWPINREKKSRSISQEIIFLRIPNFARELYQWIVQSRLNAGLKILLVGPVDFGRVEPIVGGAPGGAPQSVV